MKGDQSANKIVGHATHDCRKSHERKPLDAPKKKVLQLPKIKVAKMTTLALLVLKRRPFSNHFDVGSLNYTLFQILAWGRQCNVYF